MDQQPVLKHHCENIPLIIKVLLRIAPALAPRMRLSLGTMHKRFMLVPDIVEEMDLVLARK
jgi:hypothetical protein